MGPHASSSASGSAASARRERCFELTIQPTEDGDAWGFGLSESFDGCSTPIARVGAARALAFRGAVMAAVKGSGYPPSAVSPRRQRALYLAQAPGVRLALTVRAAAPVLRPLRRRAIMDGVEAMSSEEALYWYARTTGPDSGRALRALRLLLAET